jgi:hypothetical protein
MIATSTDVYNEYLSIIIRNAKVEGTYRQYFGYYTNRKSIDEFEQTKS